MEEINENKKRVRDESGVDSPEVKRLRDDLLGGYDESVMESESFDINSVMKSFADELSSSEVVDPVTELDQSLPVLGYLLEASDDELGLPPSTATVESTDEVKDKDKDKDTVTELVRVSSESSDIVDLWGFESELLSYDAFGLGIGDGCTDDYVPFDGGLFEYSDAIYDSSEFSSCLWRPESLPAE